MKNYKIIKIENGIIRLSIGDAQVSYAIPIIDGMLLEGNALIDYLDRSVESFNKQNAASAANMPNYSSVVSYVQSLISTDALADDIRRSRVRMLLSTDWTQFADNGLSDETKAEYAAYRSELRNISSQSTFPTSVVWPVPPVAITNPIGVKITDALGNPLI